MMVSWITLTKEQIEHADAVAQKRQQSATDNARKPKNGAPQDPANALRLNVEGARAEMAAKLYFDPVQWHDLSDRVGGLPDLDDFIDVKARASGQHELIVHRNKPDDWAYLLVRGHKHPEYEITGWNWGHEIKREENWKELQKGRPAFVMKPTRNLSELLDTLRKRQHERAVSK